MIEFIVGTIVILATILLYTPASNPTSINVRKCAFYTLVSFIAYIVGCAIIAFIIRPTSCVISELDCFLDSFYSAVYFPVDAIVAIWMFTSYLWGQGV